MVDELLSFIRSVVHEASLSNEGRRPKLDWSKIDWTQSTSVIAQQTGIAQPTVSQQRRKHAPDTIGRSFVGKTAKRTFHDWGNVDWSKSTSVVARELGADPSHVSKARLIHAPETIGKRTKLVVSISKSTEEMLKAKAL